MGQCHSWSVTELGVGGANPDVSDPQPSAASRIHFHRTAFAQVCLWNKPEDHGLQWVPDRSMHQEEASHSGETISTHCTARDVSVEAHSSVTCEKTPTAVVAGFSARTRVALETQASGTSATRTAVESGWGITCRPQL